MLLCATNWAIGMLASSIDIEAQEIVQAPTETDGNPGVIRAAEHHAAPVVCNDGFDEYRRALTSLPARRVAVLLGRHRAPAGRRTRRRRPTA